MLVRKFYAATSREALQLVRRALGSEALILSNRRSGQGVEIMAVFQRLHDAGNTIILVTHEPDVAAYAERVIHIRDGQVEKDVSRAA